jgi:hypothetical protein
MRPQHTPTPWQTVPQMQIDGLNTDGLCSIGHVENRPQGIVTFTCAELCSETDAARIVVAVNNHDALIKAVHSALWIAAVAADADINGRKAAGCVRDGITRRIEEICAALASAEAA